MKRGIVGLVVAVLTLFAAGSVAAAALADSDDEIPGVALPASPAQGYLDYQADRHDVCSVEMRKLDRLRLTLNADSTTGGWIELRMFAPGSMGIGSTDPSAETFAFTYPKTLTYAAASAGTHYVDIGFRNLLGVTDFYGNYSVSWTCKSPTLTALATRSRSIRRGATVRVRGSVAFVVDLSRIAGKSVTLLMSRTGSSWTKVRSKATDSGGAFSFVASPRRTTFYRIVSPATTSLLSSNSPRLKIIVR